MAAPAAVTPTALVPFPYRTPFVVNVVAPVPPLPTGKVPVTAAVDKSTAPKEGAPPVPSRTVLAAPTPVSVTVAPPNRTALEVKAATPVPPLPTGNVPVIADVDMSNAQMFTVAT